MKKILLALFVMLSSIILVPFAHAEASQQLIKPIQLKDEISKDFFLQVLLPWIVPDQSDYYNQHYGTKRVRVSFPAMRDVKVWLEPAKLIPNNQGYRYTDIVKIQYMNMDVQLDDKKQLKVVDTFTYGVNASDLTSYSDKKTIIRSVKLLDFNHKEIINE